MYRLIPMLVVTLLGSLMAQDKPKVQLKEAPKQPVPEAPKRDAEPKTTSFHIAPVPIPTPVLKHVFFNELDSNLQGNPIQGYLKCFMEQDNLYANRDVALARSKFNEMSMEELKKADKTEVGDLRYYGGTSVKYARRASRMTTVDWNIITEMQENGISTLLPEVQKLRELANVMSLRIRGEIIAGDFPEAITDLKVMFTLAQHLGQHPTFIGSLVGIAIARMALNRVEEMLREPNAPNLYWALTSLPHPLVKQEEGLRGELSMFRVSLKKLLEPDFIWTNKEVKQAKEFVDMLDAMPHYDMQQRQRISIWILARMVDRPWLDQARKRLIAEGRAKEFVDKYLDQQVAFLALYNMAEITRQEYLAQTMVPFHQRDEEKLKPIDVNKLPPEEAVKYVMGANLNKALQYQTALDQRIALLRGVEAVRAYAATHDGRLPKTLKETGLPIPYDPATGQPIQYVVIGDKATVSGKVIVANTTNNWQPVIEISIKK